MKRVAFFFLLLTVALGERLFFDLGSNVELVTTVMLLSAAYLKPKMTLWLVFLIMAISDFFLGTTSIFLFTWSGFLIPATVSNKLFSVKRRKGLSQIMLGTSLGIGASLFFFLWTNFGVWALDFWGMYSNDFSGLIASYTNALPFFKANLISTLLFTPIGFTLAEFCLSLKNRFRISPGILASNY